MYKGYKNLLFYKDNTNKNIVSLNCVEKCKKCNKLNPISSYLTNIKTQRIQMCMYCGTPFYVNGK